MTDINAANNENLECLLYGAVFNSRRSFHAAAADVEHT